jgi:hypothetical protein
VAAFDLGPRVAVYDVLIEHLERPAWVDPWRKRFFIRIDWKEDAQKEFHGGLSTHRFASLA